MSWLSADAEFNPDTLNNSVIGVQAELGDHDSGLHRHRMGQLLFTREGCVKLTLDEGRMLSLLPPGKVAWLPGGVSHRAEMKSSVAYRSIWFDTKRYPTLPTDAQVLNVTPLLNELLERISASPWETDWEHGPATHMAALCVAELHAAREEPMTLRFPLDKRLRHLRGDTLPLPLNELAAHDRPDTGHADGETGLTSATCQLRGKQQEHAAGDAIHPFYDPWLSEHAGSVARGKNQRKFRNRQQSTQPKGNQRAPYKTADVDAKRGMKSFFAPFCGGGSQDKRGIKAGADNALTALFFAVNRPLHRHDNAGSSPVDQVKKHGGSGGVTPRLTKSPVSQNQRRTPRCQHQSRRQLGLRIVLFKASPGGQFIRQHLGKFISYLPGSRLKRRAVLNRRDKPLPGNGEGHHRTVLHDQVVSKAAQRFQRPGVFIPLVQRMAQHLQPLFFAIEEHVLFAREVVEHRHSSHLCRRGDFINCHLLKPLLQKQPGGDVNMNKALVVIFSTICLDAVGIGLVFPILPRLLEEVTHTPDIAHWIGIMTALYALMQFVFAPLLGALSDNYGRRPVLLVSLVGAAVNYLIMAFAPHLWMLLLGRAIAGLTSANVSVAMAYITDVTPADKRARRFGLFNAMFGAGFIIGPVLGGLLGDYWVRLPFIAAAVLNTVNLLMALFMLPESREPTRQRFSFAVLNPLQPLRRIFTLKGLIPIAMVFFILSATGEVYGTCWALWGADTFGWNGLWIGLSLGAYGICQTLTQALLPGPITRWLGERGAVLFGIFSSCIALAMLAFVQAGAATGDSGFSGQPGVYHCPAGLLKLLFCGAGILARRNLAVGDCGVRHCRAAGVIQHSRQTSRA
ncbi:Tetracycline resistance protein, class A [Beauveria bassiana D1-5]|uniref:Tetracycline resistance protein, class A n=1 Tax=Beauveria bassiana D1-5 TaxID=1245745 RepID=A0A0A2W4M7_BEABA|nr:Tetracycline resistance protein, class A [Beauveria bassiana D1-5]